jgi:hypothetical protein
VNPQLAVVHASRARLCRHSIGRTQCGPDLWALLYGELNNSVLFPDVSKSSGTDRHSPLRVAVVQSRFPPDASKEMAASCGRAITVSTDASREMATIGAAVSTRITITSGSFHQRRVREPRFRVGISSSSYSNKQCRLAYFPTACCYWWQSVKVLPFFFRRTNVDVSANSLTSTRF